MLQDGLSSLGKSSRQSTRPSNGLLTSKILLKGLKELLLLNLFKVEEEDVLDTFYFTNIVFSNSKYFTIWAPNKLQHLLHFSIT